MNNDYILLILFYLNFLSFAVGLSIGIYKDHIFVSSTSSNNIFSTKNTSFKNTNKNISIDSSKIVSTISIDGLERKYDNIGEKVQKSENLSSSIEKLKQMKE